MPPGLVEPGQERGLRPTEARRGCSFGIPVVMGLKKNLGRKEDFCPSPNLGSSNLMPASCRPGSAPI